MKVAINRCYGGFGLSEEAYKFLGLEWDGYGYAFNDTDCAVRTNSNLIDCIETLKEKANGPMSEIKIVEVPDDIVWTIEDYDGKEQVEEVHRIWC